jgi:hypothetical protein
MKKRSLSDMRADEAPPPPEEPTRLSPSIDRKIQGRIGEQLRAMHNDLLAQPIPQHLVDLLRKLDAPEGKGGGGSEEQS